MGGSILDKLGMSWVVQQRAVDFELVDGDGAEQRRTLLYTRRQGVKRIPSPTGEALECLYTTYLRLCCVADFFACFPNPLQLNVQQYQYCNCSVIRFYKRIYSR